MVQLGIFLWLLFFAVLAYSMMPGYVTLVIVISFIGGLADGFTRNRRKNKKVDFKL